VVYSTNTGQNLDIQYTVGVAQGVPVTFISVGPNNRDGFEGHLDLAQYLLSMSQPPQVVTTSYGFDENNVDPRMATNLCNAYMQLGARGVSMVQQQLHLFGAKR
jgi:tripeptidyl-peptidase I